MLLTGFMGVKIVEISFASLIGKKAPGTGITSAGPILEGSPSAISAKATIFRTFIVELFLLVTQTSTFVIFIGLFTNGLSFSASL